MSDDFKNIIEQIQSRLDIVEIVSGYMPLKKVGTNFKGLCPFHQEKTPSFTVSSTKQIYHCFGCGAGGDLISFVMAQEKIEFMEALQMLAEKSGVKLPVFRQSNYTKRVSSSNFLYRINELAASYYNAILLGSSKAAQAREYLPKRGINAQTVAAFKLGFAPPGWDGFLKFAQQKQVKPETLLKAGLAITGKGGTHYDRFRNRIIFPICNAASKVVGFGARVLDDSMPKYLNSPETDIYIKGRHLYGLNVTGAQIRKKKEVIIVEGYLDLLLPFQNGISNIVATLGTALTIEQINLIKRYTTNVVIIFDADEAGEAASLRSLDVLIGEGLNVRIASLPGGFDPDSYIRAKSAEDFISIINSAKGLFDYKIDILLEKYGNKTPEAKADIIPEMLPTIKRMNNAVLKSDYIKRLSQTLFVDEKAVLEEEKKVKLDYTKTTPVINFKVSQQVRMAEKVIAALIMEDVEIARRIRDEFDLEDFKDPHIRKIIQHSFSLIDNNKQPTAARLIHCVGNEEATQFICQLLTEVENIVDREKTLEDCIGWLKTDNLKDKKEDLSHQIKEAERVGNEEKVMSLVREFNNLRGVKI